MSIHWLQNPSIIAALFALMVAVTLAEAAVPIDSQPKEGRGRIPTNFALGLANAVSGTVLPLSSFAAASWAQSQGVGLLRVLSGPVLFFMTILSASMTAYWGHRLSHQFGPLWKLHRVHHADTAVDLSTGFRHHPLELLAVAPMLMSVAILLGLSPEGILAYEGAALGFTMWSHANVALPERLEKGLRWFIVTPAMHRVHHSALQTQTDTNFGDVLSIWDRLFGTLSSPRADAFAKMRIGLGSSFDARSASLRQQLVLPFVTLPPPGHEQAREG
jgi:sterol desaturase/sphingolipid hydroxylase (fatty acid hydroxylase superfamily)